MVKSCNAICRLLTSQTKFQPNGNNYYLLFKSVIINLNHPPPKYGSKLQSGKL